MKKVSKKAASLLSENRGMGTVEMVLIIVVLIGLVVIFRRSITALVNNIFSRINTLSGDIYNAVP